MGASFLGGAAGEAVGRVQRIFSRLFLGHVSLDEEGLAHMRKVEIGVEFRGGPDFTGFEAAVIGRGMLGEVGLAPLPEVKLQVFEKSRLIAFDGEIVVRLALLDQIFGEFTLCEQGVGGDVLACNIDGLQQRDGHLNLVRAFDFFPAFYGQATDFFWV